MGCRYQVVHLLKSPFSTQTSQGGDSVQNLHVLQWSLWIPLIFLIRESERNCRAPLHGRCWSGLVISFWFLVRSLGANAYEHVRSIVTLPGKSTLQRHFGGPMHAWKEALLNTNKLHVICDLFRRLHDLDNEILVEAVLGIDAMSMEPVSCETGECPLGSNNVFLFYLMPLQCHLKSVAIHLMPRPKGNAGPDVIARAKELKMIMLHIYLK